ncbi:YbbR-like domain-containing protein [Candidatus Riflebacteria bacterium]
MNRLFLKIVSLLVSVGIWLYVNLLVNPQVSRNYKIKIFPIGDLAQKEIKLKPDEVTIKILGKRVDLININLEKLRATVDANQIKGDKEKVTLTVTVHVPRTFEKVSYSPGEVEVSVRKLFRRDFFLETRSIGDPRDGFLVDEIQPKQVDYISVLGPKLVLDRIEKVIARVDIADRNTNFSATYSFLLLDKKENIIATDVNKLKLTPSVSEIGVTFKKGYPRKFLPLKIQYTGKLAKGYRLEKDVELKTSDGSLIKTFEVEGPKKYLSNARQISIGSVDLSKIHKSQVIILSPSAPPGLKILEKKEIHAFFQVEEEILDKMMPNVPIVCEGMNVKEFNYKILPAFGDVLMSGRISEVAQVISAKQPILLQVKSLLPRSKAYDFALWYPASQVRIKKIIPSHAKVFISKKTPWVKVASPSISLVKPATTTEIIKDE